jgi:cation transport regulator
MVMTKKIEDFPQEIQQNLVDGAQQIFITAFNSAVSDGLSEDAATEVAWNSLKPNYEQGADGKWHFKQASDTGIHNKAITTGGN